MNTNLKALQGNLTREFLEGLKGGATIKPSTLNRFTTSFGYQVAITNNICEEHEVANMIAKVAWECRGINLNPLFPFPLYVGVWFDGEVWYVDQSAYVHSEIYAKELAKKYDQQSIFNWSTMDCIDTFGTGGKN